MPLSAGTAAFHHPLQPSAFIRVQARLGLNVTTYLYAEEKLSNPQDKRRFFYL
jgi:hypothetical protein